MMERRKLYTIDSIVFLADVEVMDEGLETTRITNGPAHVSVYGFLVTLRVEVLVRVP